MRTFLFVGTIAAIVIQASAVSSRAGTVNVTFSGASQAFVGVTSEFGSLTATGSGQAFNAKTSKVEPFVLTPPLVHALTPAGGFSPVNSQPLSIVPATFDVTPTAINDINGLKVDLPNGASSPVVFNTIEITTDSAISILKNFTLDISASLSELRFLQTGAATLTPLGPNIGTFSIPGDFQSFLSDYFTTYFGLLTYQLPNISETTSLPLTGTYTITGPPNAAKITLDGTIGLAILITDGGGNLNGDIDSPISLTVNASVDAAVSILVNVGYHFEQDQLVVPEPGSICLMALGLWLTALCAWRRRQSR